MGVEVTSKDYRAPVGGLALMQVSATGGYATLALMQLLAMLP